jgi:hypothetical protein
LICTIPVAAPVAESGRDELDPPHPTVAATASIASRNVFVCT